MINKAIVTTTINYPTKATLKYCAIADRDGWMFIIVGDLKTPHEAYKKLEAEYENVTYLHPDFQEKAYKELSDVIGWKCIQRRNIGFVEAIKGYNVNIVATVDDDNIPYDNWGQNLLVGKEIEMDLYTPAKDVFDPLSVTEDNYLWHRGYPIQYLQERHEVNYMGKVKRRVMVQADLWDGDPDIDAMARLTHKPLVKYRKNGPFGSDVTSPFNSQNTFLHRKVIPYYTVLPHVGRMDDIWGAYIVQHKFPHSVVYNDASVYQERNPQDLVTNLENEVIGYRNTLDFIHSGCNLDQDYVPERTKEFYEIYRKQFSES